VGAIGLLVALPAEARAVIGQGRWQQDGSCLFRCARLTETTHLIVVRSGMGLDNATIACRWLIQQGVGALGITGVSGGLDPDLIPGDLILADAVVQEEADQCRRVWSECTGFVETVCGAIANEGLPVYRGPIISVRKPVLSARGKESLFGRSKALAVDMESAAAASAAHRARLPFFAVRAICDAAERSVPSDLVECLHQGGRVHLFLLFRKLALKPALVFNLLQMKKDFGKALAALNRAWHRQIRGRVTSLVAH